MPNEQLTLDYAEGFNRGALAVHRKIVEDLLPVFRDLGNECPAIKGVLTGTYSLLYGMPMPAPKRFDGGTVEPQKERDSGWDPQSYD